MKTLSRQSIALLALSLLCHPALSLALTSEQEMASLNAGWPMSLASVGTQLDPTKSYLVIVSEPPLAHIDFRSSDNIRHSFLSTPQANLEEIGHNLFGWSCPNHPGGRMRGFTSQSGEFSNQTENLLLNGWGLSALFSTFTDGVLRTPMENELHTFQPNMNADDMKLFMVVQEVSDAQCENVVQFMQKYTAVDPQTGRFAGNNFGLNLDPSKLQGGGCGTLAVTALSTGNFFGDVVQDFWRTLNFSMSLMGRPSGQDAQVQDAQPMIFPAVPEGRNLGFNILEMMHWKPASDGANLHIVDPEMMFLFYKTIMNQELSSELAQGKIDSAEMSRLSSMLNREMVLRYYYESDPGERPLQTIPIDENYDPVAADVIQKSLAWYSEHLGPMGYSVSRPKWGTQFALVFKKN